MKIQTTIYSCDRCGKKLRTCNNSIDIVTELHKDNPWSRLHVNIIHRHGVHNDSTEEEAELCQECATNILTDAVKRIKIGERATAGTETIEMRKWG